MAAAAIDENWKIIRAETDQLFSPTVPPLDRLRNYCDFGYRFQSQMKEKYGRVLGCPLFSLGCEVCTHEVKTCRRKSNRYWITSANIRSAIRDAHAAGLIQVTDPAGKARMIQVYYEGLLTKARIRDDLTVLRDAAPGIFAMLGLEEAASKAA